MMNIFVEEYGARIDVEEDMLRISYRDEERKISFLRVSSLNLMKPCSLSSVALCTAAKHQVPVLLYSNLGKVEAWVWSPKYGNIADLRKAQVYFCDGKESLRWIIGLMEQKCHHQYQNLCWLADRVSKQAEQIMMCARKLSLCKSQMREVNNFDTLRGLEGSASRWYWAGVSLGLSRYSKFGGREKRNARDLFNQCLNYQYGILYGIVEYSLVMYGLDPYMGIYHAIQYDRPSLVYDHIEPFRPWVDRQLMRLFMKGRVSDQSREEDGSLNLELRKVLIGGFFEDMHQRSELNHKRIKKIDHIHHLSRMLVKTIRKEV
jgi:CRISPR-associated protein Cas1